ncbi:hypothetical protein HWV62_22271 [Athelia sp. TMB]|nr:hypothetical protein HWV62_22271 [Athelia sp. TMB]
MDAYLSSNSRDLADLLARMNIGEEDRAKLLTPISSPRLAYDQQIQVPRTPPPSNVSLSQQGSPTGSSDYDDSSLERSIANATIEEMALLDGQSIVEITTDDERSSADEDGDGGDESSSRCPSPTELSITFSQNPVTRAKEVVLLESYNKIGNDGSPGYQVQTITRFTGPPHPTGARSPPTSTKRARTAASAAPNPCGANDGSSVASPSALAYSTIAANSRRGTSSSGPAPKLSPPAASGRPRAAAAPQFSSGTASSSAATPSLSSRTPSFTTAPSSSSSAPSSDPPSPPQSPPPGRRPNRPLYQVRTPEGAAVIEGWDDLKVFVLRTSQSNYKGYDNVAQAQAAYMIGYNLGLVEIVANGNPVAAVAPRSVVPQHPSPEELYRALEQAADTFLGREWVVVFRGVRPGVYPSWNFVSDLVSGVSTSVYEKFDTRAEAEAQWQEARRAGRVRTLLRGISYVQRD